MACLVVAKFNGDAIWRYYAIMLVIVIRSGRVNQLIQFRNSTFKHYVVYDSRFVTCGILELKGSVSTECSERYVVPFVVAP